ncbi:MAG: hypothetical protein WCX82_01205 [archaeon]|jgi:hypothetical protein
MAKVKVKPKAIIDTSFWIHLVKLDLVEQFIQLWDLIATKKVEEELQAFTRIKLYTPLDLETYNDLKSQGAIQVKDPKSVPGNINSQIANNSGELFSIALAKEYKIIVFIDNGIPYDFCKRNQILAANIVDYLMRQYEQKKFTKEQILQKLMILESLKSMKLKYIDKARKELM